MEAENEVLELCQQVYEATGLSSDAVVDFYFDENKLLKSRFQTLSVTKNELPTGYIPLYTSDYLLEKLQSWFYDMGANDFGQFYVTMLSDCYIAKVRSHDKEFSEQASADTLLLTLLKLTLKLHEEEIL